jgi:hypothetical protein
MFVAAKLDRAILNRLFAEVAAMPSRHGERGETIFRQTPLAWPGWAKR